MFRTQTVAGTMMILLWGGMALSWSPLAGMAQESSVTALKTVLEIDLLLPVGPGDPLLAHQWRLEFERQNASVRIRQAVADETPQLKERIQGPFRVVKLQGQIDRDGVLHFPGRVIKPGQSSLLKEFLDELKVYGAQGSPAGQPLWGLTQDQFRTLKEQLKTPVAEPAHGRPMHEVLASIPIPDSLPLIFHSSAQELRDLAADQLCTDEIQGLSAGTALAWALSQQGLAFRPLRTPDGSLQLVVQPLAAMTDAWPVGWPPDESRLRNELVPGLFQQIDTGVNQAPLSTVLDAIEERSGVRILLDRTGSLVKELNPDEILVSYPRKKTAWALILSSVTVNAHLMMHYRQDEAGTGFMWIAPSEHYVPRGKEPAPMRGSPPGR